MYNNEYMGIFTYADDISLLCPTLSGIQKMLHICEEYAFNYKITFNATKSQLLYFSCLDKDHSDLLSLTMKDGNVIPYVSKCLHLIIIIIIIYSSIALISSSVRTCSVRCLEIACVQEHEH